MLQFSKFFNMDSSYSNNFQYEYFQVTYDSHGASVGSSSCPYTGDNNPTCTQSISLIVGIVNTL